jgi:ribosomal protein S18 acetylase RimI-like enzyme
MEIRTRAARPDDQAFLREMLYEAAVWRDRPHLPFKQVLANPRVALYVDGWPRPGDEGVLAEDETGRKVGAAWYRLFTDEEHGYGFVDQAVPEITVAVNPMCRGRGVGTRLLEELIKRALESRLSALSLSVEEDNPAVRLYERMGFVRVSREGNAWTMRRDLP